MGEIFRRLKNETKSPEVVWMMVVCMCKTTEHTPQGVKYGCNDEATKKCKHGFWTCNKHYHGCKDEKEQKTEKKK